MIGAYLLKQRTLYKISQYFIAFQVLRDSFYSLSMDIQRNKGIGLYCFVVKLSSTVALQNARQCVRKPFCYSTIKPTTDNSAKPSTHNT